MKKIHVSMLLAFALVVGLQLLLLPERRQPEPERHLVGEVINPISQSLTSIQGDWYVDPVSGSDANNCLSSGAACQHFWKLYAVWGGQCPRVRGTDGGPAGDLRVHLLSSQPDNTDPIYECPDLDVVDGGTVGPNMFVVGTPSLIATGKLTVTKLDSSSNQPWQISFANVDGGGSPCKTLPCEVMLQDFSNDAAVGLLFNGDSGETPFDLITPPTLIPTGNSANDTVAWPPATITTWVTGHDAGAYTLPRANLVTITPTAEQTPNYRGAAWAEYLTIAEYANVAGGGLPRSSVAINEHGIIAASFVEKHLSIQGQGPQRVGAGTVATVLQAGIVGGVRMPLSYPGSQAGAGAVGSVARQFSLFSTIVTDVTADDGANPYECILGGAAITGNSMFWGPAGDLGAEACFLHDYNSIGLAWIEGSMSLRNVGFLDFSLHPSTGAASAHRISGNGTLDTAGVIMLSTSNTAAYQLAITSSGSVTIQGTNYCCMNNNYIAPSGSLTLVSGVKAVTSAGIIAGSQIVLNMTTAGGTLGSQYQISGVGTSGGFTVTSLTSAGTTQTLDTSMLAWALLTPCGALWTPAHLDSYGQGSGCCTSGFAAICNTGY